MSESIKSQESERTKSQGSDSGIESGSSSFRDESQKTPSKVEIENGDAAKDPRTWPNARKLRATTCIGALSFLEPFASSIIAPSLEIMAGEFNITSPVERNVSDNTLWSGRLMMVSPSAPTIRLYTALHCRYIDPGPDVGVGRTPAGRAMVCGPIPDIYSGMRACTECHPVHHLPSTIGPRCLRSNCSWASNDWRHVLTQRTRFSNGRLLRPQFGRTCGAYKRCQR
jgi:hypothetical protein